MSNELVKGKINKALPVFKPKQLKFLECYYGPRSVTVGNAYKSAIAAGFSDTYARTITTNVRDLQWIKQAKQMMRRLTPEHIILGLEEEATRGQYARDRIRSWELLGKAHGIFIERSESNVNVNFVNSVPRPVVDIDATYSVPGKKGIDNKAE